MARLIVERLTKAYGTFRALDEVSLQIDDGEFVAILGPSGCGKTTLLRQVAGFDKADAGRIVIGERVVTSDSVHVPPESRHLGIVFQSYALWPHMSVAENVAYGLTVAGVKEPQRSQRVAEILRLVNLDGFADRAPAMLSGGQRQRVALARCLVTEPALVLLDEPLANLDVHLRASMEKEFARFHARTATTTVYITHDQAEAMALADRIAVMSQGRILQFAAPSQLYREPANATIARFVGDGMVVPIHVRAVNGGTCDATLFGHTLQVRCRPQQRVGAAEACVRPSAVRVVNGKASGIDAHVSALLYQGGYYRLEADIDGFGEALHLDVAEPCTLVPGSPIRLDVGDAWVIPEQALGDGR